MNRLGIALACAAFLGIAAPVHAACFGNKAFSTCSESGQNTDGRSLRNVRVAPDREKPSTDPVWSETSRIPGSPEFLQQFATDGAGGPIVGRRTGKHGIFLGSDAKGNLAARRCDRFACY